MEIKWGDLSGWAQAVGGIAAIVATWWFTRSQQRIAEEIRENDRRAQGLVLAIMLRPQIKQLLVDLEALQYLMEFQQKGSQDAKIDRVDLDTGVIKIPTAFEENWQLLGTLDNEAAIYAQLLYGELLRYNQSLRQESIPYDRAAFYGEDWIRANKIDIEPLKLDKAIQLARHLSTEIDMVVASAPGQNARHAAARWLGNR